MKHSMETEEAEKENKTYKAVKVNEKPKKVDTKQTGKWQTAEEYNPESVRSEADWQSLKSDLDDAKPASREPSENAEAKFYNRASLGNLDDAKATKVPVPTLNLDGEAPEKDPKKEFSFGPLLKLGNGSKKKEKGTLKTGKWEKAEPFAPPPGKGDQSLLEEF